MIEATTSYGMRMKFQDGCVGNAIKECNGNWETEESKAVRALVGSGDFVVDVGAHAGYYTCLFAAQGAIVTSIEPNLDLFKLLAGNILENGLQGYVRPYLGAASDQEGDANFYITDDDAFSSFRSDHGKCTRVKTYRLDQILPDGRIKLVKTDTEGAEMLVLRGLGARIADVDNVMVELNDAYLGKFGYTSDDVRVLLRAHSFSLSRSFGENELWGRNR